MITRLCPFLLAFPAGAQVTAPPLPAVDWAQRLGAQVPLDVRFTESVGREVALGEVLDGRPVVLALVYHECPMLCNLVLSGLVSCLKGTSLEPGTDFDVVVISIDPDETPELAEIRRKGWVETYGRGDTAGWRFLVGDEEEIRRVADAVGFEYTYLPLSDEYAHAAGLSVLTPEGVQSRIFYGTEFAPRDVKFGLIEASGGAIGTPIEKFVLRCFQYDPARGEYGFAIMAALRVSGLVTFGALALYVLVALRRDPRRSMKAPEAA